MLGGPPTSWRRFAVPALLLLAVALAGCLADGSGGDAGADPAKASGAPANASAALTAPDWSVGDHWTYSVDPVGEDTWVVTGEDGDDWIVDTTNPRAAFIDARFDVSFLGERGKDDLAGSQGDGRVAYFDWPLEEGKTWTTTWDGVEREITVDRVEDGVAHLTARQDGRVAVEYTYDSSVGHFGSFTFLDANGTETISSDLTRSGSDFEGTVVRWQLTRGADLHGTFGAQPATDGFGFEVPGDATDVWLDLSVRCPSGSYDFGFGRNDSGYGTRATCPDETDVTGAVIEDPDPGTYRGGFAGISPAGQGSYDVLIYVRTLQEIPVGEG